MKRLLTALVAVPLALAAIFWLPLGWFFLFVVLLVGVAILEYARLGRQIAAGVPLEVLMGVVPAVAWVACLGILGQDLGFAGWVWMFLVAAIVPLGFGSLVLFSRAPLAESLSGLGLLAFGLPYFALAIVSLTHLKWIDPWVLLLMLLVVWVGDTAAFYCGTKWGRHKLAPVVSPNKSWEGAVAGFLGSFLAALVMMEWWGGFVDGRWLVLAAVTAVAAQVGDLVESLIKRAAGVKDSGRLLPGHGGVLDRIDALLFAAPVWYFGLRLMGLVSHGP
jgi:phosphatidate cytidylyltransferase